MSDAYGYYLCGVCATPSHANGSCPACGAGLPIRVDRGYLVEFPANTLPCPGCGSTSQAIKFRGWSRVLSFFIWAREMRIAAYVCADCARKEAMKSLFFTALLGWWSVPSWFFYAWRSTYLNWRSVWAAPAKPHEWGAISATEFAADVRAAHEEAMADLQEEWLRTETPLRHLSDAQLGVVLEAEDLYELLGVDPDATIEEIRRAYRQRSKEVHPDLHQASRDATEQMMHLNQAWEIMQSPPLRAAYDWLEQQRAEEAVA
jgi:DnaJ domain